MRRRKSLIQVAPSNDRPPIIQEYFDWPPIRDPSENKQALFNDTTDRTRRKVDDCFASDDGEGEYRETNGHRSSTLDRKSTRLNSSHLRISYAVFCLQKQ